MIKKNEMKTYVLYLQIVAAAISFWQNGSMGQFGNMGSNTLLANVSDIMALVLGLENNVTIQ